MHPYSDPSSTQEWYNELLQRASEQRYASRVALHNGYLSLSDRLLARVGRTLIGLGQRLDPQRRIEGLAEVPVRRAI